MIMNNTFDESNQLQTKNKVIIYELNEVPWKIIDLYISKRTNSNLAKLVSGSSCLTTIINDPSCTLQPWRTWPTFHKSMYADEHKSVDLGQDPTTICGDNIWDVAEAENLIVGLFGVMQTWPAHSPKNGGFYIPDTFSKTSEVFPTSLQRFQEFNLSMTKKDGFNSDSKLNIKDLLPLGLSLVRRGLSIYSVLNICKSLIKERLDKRHKAGRSILQVLPCFDLYWKLHLEHQPDLSLFFTNHVAGMMHRFWGDTVSQYTEEYDYQPDEVYQNLIIQAMDHFDHQLGIIMNFVHQNPDNILIVASSMGQQGVPQSKKMAESYVVEDVDKLVRELNLGQAEEGIAMHPRTVLKFDDDSSVQNAINALESVTSSDGLKLFRKFNIYKQTLTFAINPGDENSKLSSRVNYSPCGQEVKQDHISQLGISVKSRPGGGNTGYHIPQGIMISYGSGIASNQKRQEIDILDVAPSILDILGLSKSLTMNGKSVIPLILGSSQKERISTLVK